MSRIARRPSIGRKVIRWVVRSLWRCVRILFLIGAAMGPGMPPPPPPPLPSIEQLDSDGELPSDEKS